jgi:hypothetical protein
MRPYFTITIFFIFCTILVYANETREYVATKNGITIISGGSLDSVESQKKLNNFLNFLLTKINRSGNQAKVIIQTGVFGFQRFKSDKRTEFIFVAYDTLLKRDTIYFEKSELSYNQKIYNLPSIQTWMYSSWYPLFNIDSIYSKNDVGIKIKYLGYDSSIEFYDRLIEIVNYSLTNIDKIKETQKYYRLQYFMNKGAFVSILSFDTARLNQIELMNYGFDNSLLPNDKNKIWTWVVSIFIGIIFIFILIRLKKIQLKY